MTVLGPVLLNLGPVSLPIQANRTRNICQNSVKYRPTRQYPCSPLQLQSELHQKDLRINLKYVQIQGPENEAVLEADMFLALSLIVGFYVSRGSITGRRVVISVKRPCQITVICQISQI